jgi:hypothetical protein
MPNHSPIGDHANARAVFGWRPEDFITTPNLASPLKGTDLTSAFQAYGYTIFEAPMKTILLDRRPYSCSRRQNGVKFANRCALGITPIFEEGGLD